MSIKSTIVESLTGAAGAVMTGLGDIFTSDDERNKAAIEIQKVFAGLTATILSAVNAMEQQRTDRHANDMKSDSWLSKNVRPATLVYLLVVATLFALVDSLNIPACTPEQIDCSALAGFSIKERWVTLFSGLLETAFGFYFLARGAEKVMSIYAEMKKYKVTV